MVASPCTLPARTHPNLALKKLEVPVSELTYHIPDQGSSLSPNSTSLYAAFKVISLVNGFAKRLKSQTKRKSRKERSRKGRQSRDFLEQQAYAEIDAYLGRKNKLKTKRCNASRVLSTTNTLDSEDISKSLSWIQREALQVSEQSLSAVASSNKVFLERESPFHLKHLHIQDLEAVVVATKDLLAILRRSPSPLPVASIFTLSEASLDSASEILHHANLLHLLLSLQDQLLRTLIAQLFELLREHFIECQRDRRRYSRDWFFEFPDSRHPLTTTWPWSIKASLAVIWGVCWMFEVNGHTVDFDSCYNLVDLDTGRIVAPAAAVFTYLEAAQQQRKLSAVIPHFGFPRSEPVPSQISPHARAAMAERQRQTPVRTTPQAATSPSPSLYHHLPDQPANAPLGGNASYTNNAYAQEGAAPFDLTDWPPEAQRFSGHQGTGYSTPQNYNAYSNGQAVNLWQEQRNQNFSSPTAQPTHAPGYPNNLPRRGPGHSALSISPLQTNFVDQNRHLRPPQEHSSASTSATSVVAPQAFPPSPYNNTLLRPHYNPYHQRMTEVQQHMPESMGISPAQAPMEPPQPTSRGQSPMVDNMSGRKRSYSEMSQHLQTQPSQAQSQPQTQTQPIVPSPHNSGYGASPGGGEEDGGHRVARAFKRENAPMNAENKYYCAVSDLCSKLLFDRKCEWSKHMDKHDRPYTCQERECAKLQGFTYSGGLLRHEREVHGKHGGPKEQLRCTQPGCKRQTGKGFTRKENLNEHLRRVHSINITPDNDAGHLKQIASDAAPGADGNDMSQLPYSQQPAEIDPFNFTPETSHKKRRYDEDNPRSASEELVGELQHLRAENADKDERIRLLQEADAQKEERLQKLESILNGLQQAPKIDPEMTQMQPQPPPPAPMQSMQTE